MAYLLALDQGTSSSRSIVFDAAGAIVAMAQRELPQVYPQPGWVEHDALEIWAAQLATAREALAKAGITAQGRRGHRHHQPARDRGGVEPQDRPADPPCHRLAGPPRRAAVRAVARAGPRRGSSSSAPGLLIDSYFSGTKVRWLLDNVPGAREQAERGELAFGTIDSWLLWNLTGGALHATDVSNASRTMLFDIHRNAWDRSCSTCWRCPRR
jgi:glycerol kinase